MKRVVVVDDDKDLLYTIKTMLEYSESNFDVKTFDSGIKCLDYLKDFTPDIILVDIMMPDMNGWDLVNEIKQSPSLRYKPIIFISSIADDKSKKSAKRIADDYIEKPFTSDVLLDKIKIFIEKK